VQRNFLRRELHLAFRHGLEAKPFAAVDDVPRPRVAAIDGHPPGVYPLPDAGTRKLRQQGRERLVDTLPGVLGRHFAFMDIRVSLHSGTGKVEILRSAKWLLRLPCSRGYTAAFARRPPF